MRRETKDRRRYDDILNLPHHRSLVHPPMSVHDRAAQFAPFAALTGHKDAVTETERLTEQWTEPDENRKAELDEALGMVREQMKRPPEQRPEMAVTYFLEDAKKEGGAFVTVVGRVKKIRDYERQLVMEDETVIRIDRIIELQPMPGGA